MAQHAVDQAPHGATDTAEGYSGGTALTVADGSIDFKKQVVYQIYPRSFKDSNGDGIGDLNGITEKLDYLASLGVDVLWLSPIFASPNDDNGYDISNYRAIMDEFGTMADFDRLLAEATKRGIKLMLDLVVNHTSDEHEWFQQACQSRDNPYRDYYIWRDASGFDNNGTPIPPTNWISAFSPSAWEWHEPTQQFYLHCFSVKQPDLNWENPRVREEVYDLMRFWLDKGVAGFRMDVINLISKPRVFADDPAVTAGGREASLGIIANGPRVHEFLQEMREQVLRHYPTITVGETPNTTVEDGRLYAGFDRGELNMIFTFEHMSLDHSAAGYGKWSDRRFKLSDLKRTLAHWQYGLSGTAWNSLYWNNHDQPRAVSRFGNDAPEHRVRSATMLASVLHTLCGTPYIYQGEELGMTNVFFDDIADYNDLEIHDAYEKYVSSGLISHEDMMRYISHSGRDNARTPMHWDGGPGAGFSSGTPWLALNPNYTTINAAGVVEDPDSIFNHYRRLIQLRHEHEVIVNGRFELIDPEDEQVFAFLRRGDNQTLLTVANFTDTEQTRAYAGAAAEELRRLGVSAGSSELLLDNSGPVDPGSAATLRPYEARVYLIDHQQEQDNSGKTWWKESVVYQIYPRSFQDSNDDGVGDLPGITSRLDYLADLGIDALWLSPVYASPNADNGYDISDYRAIMPEFGTMEDFEQLVDQAARRGIKIIMDLVVNHTSNQHPWFVQACADPTSAYRDYYIFRDPSGWDANNNPLPPNNWRAEFGGPAWTFHQPSGQFYLHMFSPAQPDLNWKNPRVREEIKDIVRFWLGKKVAGFRLDAINLISKPENLPDDPEVDANKHGSSIPFVDGGEMVHPYLQQLAREVFAPGGATTVGETPLADPAEGLLYAGFDRNELHTIFHFEHMLVDCDPESGMGKWSTREMDLRALKKVLNTWQVQLQNRAWNALYWNNHDQPRIVSRFGDPGRYRVQSATMLATVLHGMCGTPYVYQGEELGMTNVQWPDIERYRDLDSLNFFDDMVRQRGELSAAEALDLIHAKGRDNARTPMQWSTEGNAGFSSVAPWLDVNDNYREINAAAQVGDPENVYSYYRRLISLRHGEVAGLEHIGELLVYGDFVPVAGDAEDGQVYSYLRVPNKLVGSRNSLLVMANFSRDEQQRDIAELAGVEHSVVLSNYNAVKIAGTTVSLRPYQAVMVELVGCADGAGGAR